MMPTHKVQQGESINGIALNYGFAWKHLWDLPENEDLRNKRGDPQVLFEGDKVFYPERKKKQESGSTERKHTFRCRGVPFELRIRIVNTDGSPVAKATWYFVIDGEATPEGTTDDDGRIVQKVPGHASRVRLFVNDLEIPIRLRYLDPAHTVRGIQQRLANLGYEPGPIDGIIGPRTRSAIAHFQTGFPDELEVTGDPDKNTVMYLRKAHDHVDDDQRNAVDGTSAAPGSLVGDDSGPEPEAPDEPVDDERDLPPDDYADEMAPDSDVGRPMSVKCLQTMLVLLGYRPGTIDGLLGPRTASAVRAFQGDHQTTFFLAIDGIAGPKTRTALRKAWNG